MYDEKGFEDEGERKIFLLNKLRAITKSIRQSKWNMIPSNERCISPISNYYYS